MHEATHPHTGTPAMNDYNSLRAARELAVHRLNPDGYADIQKYLQDVDCLAHYIKTGEIQRYD